MRCCRMILCLSLLILCGLFPARAAPVAGDNIKLNDILAAFDSQPLDATRLEKARTVLNAPIPPEVTDRTALASRYWARGRAAAELGLSEAQITAMREVVTLGGGDNPGRAWRELAMAELNGGNLQSAIEARQKALQLTAPNLRGRLVSEHTGLADLYRRIGDFSAVQRHVKEAESILLTLRHSKAWGEFQYIWQASVEDALGRQAFDQGRYSEAEARFRKAKEYVELDLPQNALRLARGMESPPQFQAENYRDALEAWLASALWKQGRVYEAEVHARRAAYNSIGRSGQDSIETSKFIQQLILILSERDQLLPALQLVERLEQSFERQKLPAEAFFVLRNQRLKANILAALGRWQAALDTHESMQRTLKQVPALTATLGSPTLGWIRALLATGQVDSAVTMARQLAAQQQKALGEQAYETAETMGYLAAALARQGQGTEALKQFRAATAILVPAASAQSDRSTRRFRRFTFIIERYLALLADLRQQSQNTREAEALIAEAFVVADTLRGQAVQQAMAASAARAAASTPELAALVREEQDLRTERAALHGIQADLMSRRADQVPQGILADMTQRVRTLDSRLNTLSVTIRQRFPDYADLVTPRPVSLPTLRTALRPGEALLSILCSEEATYLWAIPAQGEAAFAALPEGRERIDALVGQLRAALDPGDVSLAQLPAFDGQQAHALYQKLLAPVEKGWRGAKHLIIATGGSLGRLPLSVLLTAPPPATAPSAPASGKLPFAHYAHWPWLIRDLAISQLPAANALPTLRQMKPGAPDRLAFAGFGDPEFGAPGQDVHPPAGSSRRLRATVRTSTVDYSRIPPLPETRDEMTALAQALHADPARDLFLGRAASRETALQQPLNQRKIVAFATHGLLAGEYPGVEQPALALANPGNGQHGLLTLDDILTLKLDADWVILSACNTSRPS